MKKFLKYITIGLIIIIVTIFVTFIIRENFFKFDKKLSKENKNAIEQYISDISSSHLEEEMTFLSTYYFGDRFNDDKLTVYLWVLYDEYISSATTFEKYRQINAPYKIVIDTSNDQFKIIDYTLADNNNLDLFPIAIKPKVNSFLTSKDYDKLIHEQEELINTYKDYFKGDI